MWTHLSILLIALGSILPSVLIAQPTGKELIANHAEYSKTYTYEEGESVYFSLSLAPDEWQKGVILEIHEEHLIIADNNKRGLARLYPLTDINALWPRPVWLRIARGVCLFNLLGATTFTISVAELYRQMPNLSNFSSIVLGASGMVLFSIPLLVRDKMPLSGGWEHEVVALPK
ncbi:MAG: hypothetical protein AAFQ98_24475 [Bacteroidota bacterium]